MNSAVTEGSHGETETKQQAEQPLTTLTVLLPAPLERMLPINSEYMQKGAPVTYVSGSSGSSLLLECSSNAHRSAFLFQAAVSFTIESAAVAYICPNSFTKLPPGVHGMKQSNQASGQRLKMMYLPSGEDLIGFLASLHQLPNPPEVLIIDDLHLYISQNEDAGLEHGAARLCAHLVDALHTMQTKSGTQNVHLILGANTVNCALSELWPQFFHAVYTVKDTSNPKLFQMVPVSSSRHQVPALLNQRRPLVSVHYIFHGDSVSLDSIHSGKSSAT